MKKILFLSGLLLFNIHATMAGEGGEGGGGGDASEMRVNEIRADILSWIKKGGSESLNFQGEITLQEYNQKMMEILKPKKVLVSFVETEIKVNDVPKTCKNYYSQSDSRYHIVCNIKRFGDTSDIGQYKLIHHEYAGIVNLEQNDGAISDYDLSTQLTSFLENTTIKKLSTKRSRMIVNASKNYYPMATIQPGSTIEFTQDFELLARKKKHQLTRGFFTSACHLITNASHRNKYIPAGTTFVVYNVNGELFNEVFMKSPKGKNYTIRCEPEMGGPLGRTFVDPTIASFAHKLKDVAKLRLKGPEAFE